MFHFDLPANVFFFFRTVDHILIVWRILCSVGVCRVFRGRSLLGGGGGGEGTLPYLALRVMSPWERHSFQGLGQESFTRIWRLDISSGHLWYRQFFSKKIQFHNVSSKNKGLGLMASANLVPRQLSQRFGHPRVLGIPIPISLAFWASPVGDAQNTDRFDFA